MFEKVYPIKVTGRWNAKLYDQFGNLKQEVSGKNVITEGGLDYLASYLHSATTSGSWDMIQIAIGDDATAEAASNTALGSELSRHTGTAGSSGAIYRVVATFAAGSGTGAIVEYGLFNSSAGGTMFSRDTESVINKGALDTLTVTTEVTFS